MPPGRSEYYQELWADGWLEDEEGAEVGRKLVCFVAVLVEMGGWRGGGFGTGG